MKNQADSVAQGSNTFAEVATKLKGLVMGGVLPNASNVFGSFYECRVIEEVENVILYNYRVFGYTYNKYMKFTSIDALQLNSY